MDALQKMLANVSRQLGALSASQKLALLLGGLLVAVSLIWMVQWAAQPELVPLLDGAISAEDLAAVRSGLDAMGEPHEIRGDRIYVRGTANQHALLAQLQQMEKLPADFASGFAALIKESSPWLSQAENDRRWTVALQNELQSVLKNFTGVQNARVFLNLNTERRGFARTLPPGSASVTLFMRGGEPITEKLAKAAARLVSGAVRGLPIEQVAVVDSNGNSVLDWQQDQAGGTPLQRARAEQERLIREKIRGQLAFDPKALVSVRVELNFSTELVESHALEDPVDVSEEISTEQRSRARDTGQAGVQPNVGLAVAGGGGDEQYTKETSRSEKQAGYTHTTRQTPGGETFAIFAAISISHTYLESVYKRFNPDAQAPTQEQIETLFAQERDRIIAQVAKLVKASDERNVTEQVAVSWYFDPTPADQAAAASSLDSTMMLAQRYGPQAGLGLLALVALGMMFRLSRKSDAADSFGLELGLPKEAIEAARAAARDVSTFSGRAGQGAAAAAARRGIAAGGAPEEGLPSTSATEGVLVAQEVDENMVQIQKMLEEVDEIVAADADAIATLMEQWIDRSDKFGS